MSSKISLANLVAISPISKRTDAIGTHQELIETNAIYREVYDMQTQGKGGKADEE